MRLCRPESTIAVYQRSTIVANSAKRVKDNFYKIQHKNGLNQDNFYKIQHKNSLNQDNFYNTQHKKLVF